MTYLKRWNEHNYPLLQKLQVTRESLSFLQYTPVEGKPDAEEHYKNLTKATTNIPKHVLLVVGHFNAHSGKTYWKLTYHDSTNKNEQLTEEAKMLVTNTSFKKKKGKLWTYISDMSGVKSQVDCILIGRKLKNSVKNCEVFSSFSSIISDHRIVISTIKLSLRITK